MANFLNTTLAEKEFILKKNFIILLFLFISFMLSCNHAPEPYTVVEKQDVSLTYLIKDNKIYYERIGGAVLLGTNPNMKIHCTVTNTSDYGGVFKLFAKLSSQGNILEFQKEQYIDHGATVEFTDEKECNPYSFETNVKVDAWGIAPPTKSINVQVTKYK